MLKSDLDNPNNMNTAYDQTPYTSFPYAQSHPARLATIAMLLGLRPPNVTTARVLELGCCSGGNLVPMAEQFPDAQFVGIDASARQIADGQVIVGQLGLGNVNLLAMDILDVGPDLGKFDYIVCHGVYSWVPRNVQDKILSICRDNLTPDGAAYVSYNTLPGWRMRGVIRDIMLYRARGYSEPSERIGRARSLVDFLARSVAGEQNPYGMLLRKELELLTSKDDSYLLHDHLEEHNEPVYFSEFASRASEAGLAYLGEADYGSTDLKNVPEQVRLVIENIAGDEIELQQYLDFLMNRTFRQTLLCHKGAAIDRDVKPERLLGMYVASPVRPEKPIENLRSDEKVHFRGPSAVTTTIDPIVKAALMHLGDIWPVAVSFIDLVAIARSRASDAPAFVDSEQMGAQTRRLAATLIRCYSTGQVELTMAKPTFTSTVTEKPIASRCARLQAASSNTVTNYRHETVRLSDLERQIVLRLDGTNSLTEIIEDIGDSAMRGTFSVMLDGNPLSGDALKGTISTTISGSLSRIARLALLAT